MVIKKTAAILAIAGLALGAAACGGSSNETAASTTAPVTAKSDSTTTTEGEDDTTTTTEDDEPSTTRVTKPAKVEKIERSQLPESTPVLPADFEITADEEDCVYTVILDYVSDPDNAQDDATLAGVTGGAMAACIDQDKLAAAITSSVAEEAPNLDNTQLACIEAEIAGTDTESLAIFLGAFIYEGPEAEELQQPFIDALDEACGLST